MCDKTARCPATNQSKSSIRPLSEMGCGASVAIHAWTCVLHGILLAHGSRQNHMIPRGGVSSVVSIQRALTIGGLNAQALSENLCARTSHIPQHLGGQVQVMHLLRARTCACVFVLVMCVCVCGQVASHLLHAHVCVCASYEERSVNAIYIYHCLEPARNRACRGLLSVFSRTHTTHTHALSLLHTHSLIRTHTHPRARARVHFVRGGSTDV
jgi:hypothetical protein